MSALDDIQRRLGGGAPLTKAWEESLHPRGYHGMWEPNGLQRATINDLAGRHGSVSVRRKRTLPGMAKGSDRYSVQSIQGRTGMIFVPGSAIVTAQDGSGQAYHVTPDGHAHTILPAGPRPHV